MLKWGSSLVPLARGLEAPAADHGDTCKCFGGIIPTVVLLPDPFTLVAPSCLLGIVVLWWLRAQRFHKAETTSAHEVLAHEGREPLSVGATVNNSAVGPWRSSIAG